MGSEYVEVTTKSGKLRGLVKTSELDQKTYYSFQGIPYAKPPVGDLRFKPAEKFGSWEGVRDALKEGSDCAQNHMLFNTPTGEEDCLYLNVYTPQLEGKKLAVMVWIHGGGFARGSGSSELYGPDYMIEQDVVLVTINYRCGIFGFLSLENDKVPGNNGLKDQNMALRWVQEHIESFGGDPGNVTIFGQSAGAASVHYHLLSPSSKGLYHKAILQSGDSLCQWAFQNKPKEKALILAKQLGCTSQDPDKVLEFLKSVPAQDLVRAQEKDTMSTDKEAIQRYSLLFVPCVEVAGSNPFLTDNPRKLMERGEFNKVPVILGQTDKEGLVALSLKTVKCEKVNRDLSLLVPTDLVIPGGIEEERKLGKEILQFYTHKDTLDWDNLNGYLDYVSDVEFTIALEDIRQMFFKHKVKPVFSYLFSYVSHRAYYSNLMIPKAYPGKGEKFIGSGANHGDELVHEFRANLTMTAQPPPPENQVFIKKFVGAWASFAKTGNPNFSELGSTWKEDTPNNPSYLDLGEEIKSVSGYYAPKRMEFWKKINAKYSYSV